MKFDPKATRRWSVMSVLARTDETASARYVPGEVLGQGGMGVVVSAKDLDLARAVAIKQLKSESPSASLIGRFLREAQITAQLEHPGIVPVHDIGTDETGRFYYVMRLVQGEETLRRIIDRLQADEKEAHAVYTLERRVRIIQQVAHILGYAHARGVIHRDVKPENIMVGVFGEVYLLDWGLAKVLGDDGEAIELTAPLAATETQPGLLGTPLYMSPEQATGEDVTPRSDLYSLVAVLYELVTLRHYLGETQALAELVEAIRTRIPTRASDLPPRRRNGRVPRPLARICEKGLAKDPARRHESASELEEALQRWSEGECEVSCPQTFLLSLLNRWRRIAIRHPEGAVFFTLVLPGAIFVLALVIALVLVIHP